MLHTCVFVCFLAVPMLPSKPSDDELQILVSVPPNLDEPSVSINLGGPVL